MRLQPKPLGCLLGAALFLCAAPFAFARNSVGQATVPAKPPAKSGVAAKAPASPAAKSGSRTSASTTAAASKPAAKKSTARKKTARTSQARGRRQTAPTSARISEIQSALAQAGHYQGEPNGKWDAASVAAMKKFQEANSLPATGKYDAKSLQKLGLGSQVAGLAAPRPPADSAAPTRP